MKRETRDRIFAYTLLIIFFLSHIPIMFNVDPVRAGSNYFVAPNGNDSTGDGSIGNPFKTILRGINATSAGDTVMVRAGYYAGVYFPNTLGGSEGSPITIQNYNGEKAVVNRSCIRFGGGNPNYNGLFEFNKQSWMVIDGLEFHNATKFAIALHEGHETQYVGNITIQNCYFWNNTDGAVHTDAYRSGIPDHYALYNVIIRNNTCYNNNNGWYNTPGQECFSMYECRQFHIYDNTISLNWKICIDAKAGARDGEIYNNTINTSHPNLNPHDGYANYYWNGGGITLDGASTYIDNISVFNNTIFGNKTGITISTESGGTSSNITIYNNILNLTGSTDWSAIIIWHKSGVSGQYKENIYILFNTIFTNSRAIYLDEWDYHMKDITIANNILDTSQNTIGIDWLNATTNHTVRNNLFNVSTSDIYGVGAVNGTPLFNNSLNDFTLKNALSPAVDSGSNAHVSSVLVTVTHDKNGVSRPYNSVVDMGAYEYNGPAWVYYSNTPPTITNPSPTNNTGNIGLTPNVVVTITDANGNNSQVTFLTSTDGIIWTSRQSTSGVLNTTAQYSYTQASSYSTWYYWKVYADDGHDNVSVWYRFQTRDAPLYTPTIGNPNPSNHSFMINISLTQVSVVINDPNGDAFDWTIQISTGDSSSANGDSNGTKTCSITGDLPYSTNIFWWVNATDGANPISKKYVFTTDVSKAQPGSGFLDNIWNTSFSPWTNLFNNYVGNGNVFYLFPLIIITLGLYIHSDHNSLLTSMFMIGSGALLGVGTLSMGLPHMPILFGIFAAMGLVPLFSHIFFGE